MSKDNETEISQGTLSRRNLLERSSLVAAMSLVSGCRQNRNTITNAPGNLTGSTSGNVGAPKEIAIALQVAEIEYAPNKRMKTFTIGGTVPGQLIEAQRGERLRITVHNQLPEASSLHWHGVPLSNPMDGVPGVTQEPIPVDGKFVSII